MKKLLLVFSLVLIAAGLGACGTPVRTDKAVEEDILNYANVELQGIVDLESDVLTSYGSISGDSFTDDETMLNALESSVIPKSTKLIEAAEKIIPNTKEVKDVHQIYLSGIKEQHSAFVTMVSAIKKQSTAEIQEANNKLQSAAEKTQNFVEELQKLADENFVTFGEQ